MHTQCNSPDIEFNRHGRREVTAAFDGGRMSSDGGALLLREADRVADVTRRLAECLTDYRDQDRIEHGLRELVAQRVMAIALGYEDVNDHDRLRDDSVLALAVGRDDITGADRPRERDRGHPLAGSSTLNRLELGTPEAAETDRYRRIVADGAAIERLMVDLFLDAHEVPPGEIVLDVDATDDPLHGAQEGRFFHGYYRHYCYLPLYVTCGDHVLLARLRPANIDASEGSVEALAEIVERIRSRWPETAIIVRGDSGFCRESLMAWCEANGVDYVLGLARNSRLVERIAGPLERSRRRAIASGKPSRRFRDFRYRTRSSWSRTRRVVGKAEWLPGPGGANPRFVVTSLPKDRFTARNLYEKLYCARGDMENRIKEQQLELFADRTSTATMRANQLRLYLSAFAGALLRTVRAIGLAGTDMARAQCGTIRTRLLKVACRVTVSVRRVRLSLSSVFPLQDLFARAVAALLAAPSPQVPPPQPDPAPEPTPA